MAKMEMDCNLTVLGEFIQALSMCLRKNPLKQIMVCFPFTKITLYRPLRVLGAFLVQGKSLRHKIAMTQPLSSQEYRRLVPSRHLFIPFRLGIREGDQCAQSLLGRREKKSFP